jgi:ribosome-associated protein
MTINPEKLQNHISWQFIRASGPGGQHVNKTSSAVQLHFNVGKTQVLNEMQKKRLYTIAGNRINKQQEFLIRAQHEPKKRKKTKVSKGAKAKTKKIKQQHSQKKQKRKAPCEY